METSPVCELTLPILPGKQSEKRTLAKDLLNLLNDKPNLHVFFLTSRPVGAAGNIIHILKELSRSAGLEEDALFQFIRQRNGGLQLDTQKFVFEHEINIIADGVCIASGRNRKDIVINAFFEQLGDVLHQTVFIDDNESYIAEVARLENRVNKLVVAQQTIPNQRNILRIINSNPELSNQVHYSIRNAIAGYPIHQLPGNVLSSATNLALSGLMMLGIMLTPPEEPLAGQAAMALGRDRLANMLTGRIPRPINQNRLFFLATSNNDIKTNPKSILMSKCLFSPIHFP